jgi:guanosine-3',5'-bis(diphosphate) 3'-pyrophosphohydrolase
LSTSLLLRAADFAARRHVDQYRKGELRVPYVSHPLNVARLISESAGIDDTDVLAAAMLHDTLEDTVDTREEFAALRAAIALEFGEAVAVLVEEVTDDKWLEKCERKRLQIEHAPRMSVAAATIKAADKLCNVRDAVQSPPSDWSLERRIEYVDHAERVVRSLPAGVPAGLLKVFNEEIDAARARMRADYLAMTTGYVAAPQSCFG